MKMAVLGVAFVLLTSLVFQAKADGSLVLDNNEFFIYNKKYHKARLAMFGTGWYDFGTYELGLADNQLWQLEPHPTQKGCYYVINEHYSYSRLADSIKKGLIVSGNTHYDDQLWSIVPAPGNNGYYSITNCFHKSHRIAKTGAGNYDVKVYSGNSYDDQLWKLVPRFEAKVHTDQVFHYDNRQGSGSFTREISVTTGVTRSTTSSIRSQVTFMQSITASVEGSGASAESTTEFTAELESSFSETNEASWAKTETILFTIPAGKNFKVMQHKVDFKGKILADSCTLMTSIKIFESDANTFSDPDNFIIKS